MNKRLRRWTARCVLVLGWSALFATSAPPQYETLGETASEYFDLAPGTTVTRYVTVRISGHEELRANPLFLWIEGFDPFVYAAPDGSLRPVSVEGDAVLEAFWISSSRPRPRNVGAEYRHDQPCGGDGCTRTFVVRVSAFDARFAETLDFTAGVALGHREEPPPGRITMKISEVAP